ncbi:ABC transporter ATP-binding protein [Micromonospora sp. NPDC047074]|uniref:ABC transporter ATP-binding protein n=1 Tax=Micromonospora sp. NPDC047074 TaxID=3154339 RepID=UPI0033E61779
MTVVKSNRRQAGLGHPSDDQAATPPAPGGGTDGGGVAFSLEGVSVSFPGSSANHPALDDVSLRCRDGEFLVLVGRSGSGKTTILNVLSGLLEPDAGEVSILGGRPRAARPRMGFMFARDALMPWRTARRNVELGLEILGRSGGERREAATSMLERVGLGHAVNRLPWQLSQGMRQRVALARTWVRQPKLLLMDEPFSALDAQTRRESQQVFLETWAGTSASVVLVTHDLTEALLLADRLVLLSAGRILREVEIPFERPRDLDQLVVSQEFRDLERELWELLR